MSGPPYPRAPATGSNAIGSFQIGVSQIGTIQPFDFWNTILSQYANSPILMQLIENFSQYLDQTKNMDDFYDLIFNVDTAIGRGLDVWGRIVGVKRVLTIEIGTYIGFNEQQGTIDTMGPGGQSPLYSGVPATSNYTLADDAYRTLILAKALANISDGSIPAINQLLVNLFHIPGQGNCFVTDDGEMTMTYTFNFKLSPVQVAIITQSGVLPKPVGVLAAIVQNF